MEQNQETYLYVEAANGMTVRVPESELEAWQRGQEKLKNKDPEATKAVNDLVERLRKRVYGDSNSQQQPKA